MTHYVENISIPYRQKRSSVVAKTTEKLTSLSNLSHFLVGSDTIEDLVDRAKDFIVDLIRVDVCNIFILEQNGHFRYQFNDSRKSQVLEKIYNRLLWNDQDRRITLPDQTLTSIEKFSLGLSEKDHYLIIPLSVENTTLGLLLLGRRYSQNYDAFPGDAIYMIDLVADQLANALNRKQLNERLVNSSIETVLALSKTLETRDSYSGSHSKRMASFSERISQYLGFSTRETRELCWAALLHDIGKIGIEDQILHKPGPLTYSEWDIMKSHPELGAQIVKGLTGLERLAPLILSHHERYDGSGYPNRLCGDEILLGARIIAVVDSYTAMTEGRVYRSPRSHEEALMELQKFSGKMYDPEIVKVFTDLFESSVT